MMDVTLEDLADSLDEYISKVESRADGTDGDFPATYHAGPNTQIGVGGESGGINQGSDSTVIFYDLSLIPEQYHIHDFPINILRAFPKILINAVLEPDVAFAPLTSDYLSYWGFTFKFFDLYNSTDIEHDPTREEPILSPEHDTDPHPLWHFTQQLLSIVELIRLSRVQSALMENMNDVRLQFLRNHLPVTSMQGFSLASTMSFPIMEGMIRRHCPNLSEEGVVETDNPIDVRESFGGRYGDGHQINALSEALELWRVTASSPTVREVLKSIDDVDYVSEKRLYQKFGYTPPEGKRDPTSLFKEIHNQRNHNIHGEGNTMVVTSVLLSLTALLCWDSVSEENFEKYRSALVGSGYNRLQPYYAME